MKDRYFSPETRRSIADIARKRGLSLVVIDRELVMRKIVLIGGDLEELRKFDAAGLEAYLADPYKEILAERFLHRLTCDGISRERLFCGQ